MYVYCHLNYYSCVSDSDIAFDDKWAALEEAEPSENSFTYVVVSMEIVSDRYNRADLL